MTGFIRKIVSMFAAPHAIHVPIAIDTARARCNECSWISCGSDYDAVKQRAIEHTFEFGHVTRGDEG